MYRDCFILSEPIKFPDNIYTPDMEEKLYYIFKNELFGSIFVYQDKPVFYRRFPLYKEREEAFYHIIAGKDNPMITGYQQDIVRASRIRWGKEIICNTPCQLDCCEGIEVWEQNKRTKFYHKKYNYLVILEERKDYWLYITSYRLSDSYSRRKILKEAHEYKSKKRLTI